MYYVPAMLILYLDYPSLSPTQQGERNKVGSVMISFQSFHQYLLSTYYVPLCPKH